MPATKEFKVETSALVLRPRSGTLRMAVAYSGISRAQLYELAAVTSGLFRKNGASTIVDFNVLDEVIDALPAAEISRC